jgi:hypothetical protein
MRDENDVYQSPVRLGVVSHGRYQGARTG